MKKLFLSLFGFLVLVSCGPSAFQPDYIDPYIYPIFGFGFYIGNNTDTEYSNAKVTIGGIKNGVFVGTESYTIPNLSTNIVIPDTPITYYFPTDDRNGWRPNLDTIRNISDSETVYFQFELEGVNKMLTKGYTKGKDTISFPIPTWRLDEYNKGRVSIKTYIYIYNDSIVGYSSLEKV